MSPQPVTGFLTANGKYFQTEWEANLYEQSLELNNRVTAAVVALRENVHDNQHIDDFFSTLPEKVITFINVNEDLIRAYIAARQTIVESPDGLDRPATTDNQDDDSRVRVGGDVPVGKDALTEVIDPPIGEQTPRRARK